MKNRLKTGSYTCRSLWTAGRRDSTVFGVVDDTTTTKFVNRACAVHGISLPVVVDKAVVVVLKFPIGDLEKSFPESIMQSPEMGQSYYDSRTLHRPISYYILVSFGY